MKYFTIIPLLTAFAGTTGNVLAHEMRPAYLELKQASAEDFAVMWKVPARGENMRLAIYPRFPENAVQTSEPQAWLANGAHIEHWRMRHSGALVGSTLRIDGLESTMTDVLVRMERLDGSTQVERLTPTRPSFIVAAAPSAAEVAWTYLGLGVEHILLGVDHLLFVFALLFLVKGWKRLVGTITAFTLAHSITLAAASLGFVHVPGPPVEAIIALSIVFVASEIVRERQGRTSLSARSPWIVAFSFGLLHGLGFAGALSEIGLPQQAIPVALLCFNLGVEVGQLSFVAALILALYAARRLASIRADRPLESLVVHVRVPAAYAVGGVASYWLIERIYAWV